MCYVACAFPGSGKSSFSKYNVNTIDLDSGVVREQWRHIKEQNDERNIETPDFDDYYIGLLKDILDQNEPGKIKGVFMSTHPEIIRKIQYELGEPIILIYPNVDMKEEFMDRYRHRGDWDAFLKQLDENFGSYVKDCHNAPLILKSKRIVLERFENVSDRIGFDGQSGFFVKKVA